MALAELVARPIVLGVFAALVSDDADALERIPEEVFASVIGEILGAADAHAEQMNRIEEKLDLIIEQDFERDFGAARMKMGDAARRSAPDESATELAEAWDSLARAAAGTKNPLLQADALYLAAVLALQRRRPDDAVDRARGAWRSALSSFEEDYHAYVSPSDAGEPVIARARRLFSGERSAVRVQAATRCVAACRSAEEVSVLLGALKQHGHPTALRALPPDQWAGVREPLEHLSPAISLVGEKAVCLPNLAILSPTPRLIEILPPEVTISDPAYASVGLRQIPLDARCVYVDESQIVPTGAQQFPQSNALEPAVAARHPRSARWIRAMIINTGGKAFAPWTAYVRDNTPGFAFGAAPD